MTGSGVRHDCKESGVCFNEAHRLKFGTFASCWRRWSNGKWEVSAIRPSDVDFIIEQRGNFLMMEWKAHGDVFGVHTGQGIMFRMLARRAPMTIVLCEGNASDMVVNRLSVLYQGYDTGPLPATTYNLRQILHAWSMWAEKHPQEVLYPGTAAPAWMPECRSTRTALSRTHNHGGLT